MNYSDAEKNNLAKNALNDLNADDNNLMENSLNDLTVDDNHLVKNLPNDLADDDNNLTENSLNDLSIDDNHLAENSLNHLTANDNHLAENSLNDLNADKIVTHSSQHFIDDSGDLPLDTRRVLVHLLTGPSLEAERHSKLWPVLLRDEAIIRSRLSELFLALILDRELHVAFIRQADTGELEVPHLLRRAQLTFLDSVLLLHLRQLLTQADVRSERATVASSEMIDHLTLYERGANTDSAGFTARTKASIEKFKKYNILRKIRHSENRFEISPTLKLLFSAEEIQSLTHLYQHMTAKLI